MLPILIAGLTPVESERMKRFDALVTEHGLKDTDVVLFVDNARPITEHRFFVYDLATRRIVYSDHVGHARKSGFNVPHTFSNIFGSHMTSLGRYRIGVAYESQTFGTSVRLNGLEKGNSRALDRDIVVHDVQGGIVVSQSRFAALYSKGCFTFLERTMPAYYRL